VVELAGFEESCDAPGGAAQNIRTQILLASCQARSEGVVVGGSFHGIVLPRLPAAPYDLIARQQRTIADNRYAVYEMVGILGLVNPDRDLFWGIVPTLIGIVSLSGSLLFIGEIRKVSKLWYFGIPHAIALIILCSTGPVVLIRGGNNLDFLSIALALLSITSVSVFLSFPDSRRKFTRLFALISGIISIYAIICIYYLIGGILSPLSTSWNVVGGLTAIYWMILMSLIGMCYIATALWLRE
jgi:hypothetical protein